MRSVSWLGAFSLFVLCTIASVIQWSFRWYLLGGLLLIWAVLSAWRLLRKQAAPRALSAVRTVFGTIGLLLLILVAVTSALIFP